MPLKILTVQVQLAEDSSILRNFNFILAMKSIIYFARNSSTFLVIDSNKIQSTDSVIPGGEPVGLYSVNELFF